MLKPIIFLTSDRSPEGEALISVLGRILTFSEICHVAKIPAQLSVIQGHDDFRLPGEAVLISMLIF